MAKQGDVCSSFQYVDALSSFLAICVNSMKNPGYSPFNQQHAPVMNFADMLGLGANALKDLSVDSIA